MAKTTFEDIKKALWAGANTFRDNIDAANYKDYVLSMFFVKYLSDTYAESVDDLKEKYPSYDKTRCFVTHSTAEKELVEEIKQKVKETFEFDEILETVAGSIVTSHCGQGTLGVLFIYNK